MAKVTVDEERLREFIQDAVQKHLKDSLDDMEEVRRSPAAAIVRLETRLEAIEKNMVTKADLAELRTELIGRINRVESGLSERIGKVESGLNERISKVEASLIERIGKVEAGLSGRISEVESNFNGRLSKVETGQKIMFGVFLSMLSAIIAMLIKLVFFP